MSVNVGHTVKYWYDLAKNEDNPMDWLQGQMHGQETDMRDAIEKAQRKIEQEQRDIPKIKREIEALGWTRIGAIAAVVAIPVALVSIGLTYWLAKGACS